MKPGDLVNFTSDFFSAFQKYASPGIIIVEDDSHRQMLYTVLWADGNITTEIAGYLTRVGVEDFETG